MDRNNTIDEKYLLMVELGCGGTKSPGYIGIDRYNMPNVDIVADLNKGIPLKDNSVDVLFAVHSLEYLDDIQYIVTEIFRVCKHKAIINIIAPYDNTSLDIANFYHKVQFNEHIFRFFTKHKNYDYKDEFIIQPTIQDRWGLSESDNSQTEVDIRTINIDYLYFHEYNQCSEEVKNVLRQNLRNICHSIVFSLVAWKGSDVDLTVDEIKEFKNRSAKLLSKTSAWPLIKHWDTISYNRPTIYSIYKKDKERSDSKYSELEARIENLYKELEILNYSLSDDNLAMFRYFKKKNITFYDGIVLNNKNIKGGSRLRYSDWLSTCTFFTYFIDNRENNDILFYNIDIKSSTSIVIEAVANGQIFFNDNIDISQSGSQIISLKEFPKKFYLRFALQQNKPDARILELVNKQFLQKIFMYKRNKVSLASYFVKTK